MTPLPCSSPISIPRISLLEVRARVLFLCWFLILVEGGREISTSVVFTAQLNADLSIYITSLKSGFQLLLSRNLVLG